MSISCLSKNAVTASGPKVNDGPSPLSFSFSFQPTVFFSGSAHSKSHSRPTVIIERADNEFQGLFVLIIMIV